MASNSQNPHLECEDGSPEEEFVVAPSESAVLASSFGRSGAQG